jgi:hypothetical protein
MYSSFELFDINVICGITCHLQVTVSTRLNSSHKFSPASLFLNSKLLPATGSAFLVIRSANDYENPYSGGFSSK